MTVWWYELRSTFFKISLSTPGATQSHTKSFRDQRRVKIERCVVETNKILIRLRKVVIKIV